MNYNLLEILACPICHCKLHFNQKENTLICKKENLSFPFRNGIPVLLKYEAFNFSLKEKKL